AAVIFLEPLANGRGSRPVGSRNAFAHNDDRFASIEFVVGGETAQYGGQTGGGEEPSRDADALGGIGRKDRTLESVAVSGVVQKRFAQARSGCHARESSQRLKEFDHRRGCRVLPLV